MSAHGSTAAAYVYDYFIKDLNYVFFDRRFKFVGEGSGVKQVDGDPGKLETLSSGKVVAKKNGYVYVYTSNESQQDVLFDNLGVLDITGPVLEETHYYPFGLTMTGISTTAALKLEGKRKFNGIEFNHKEFSDGSGLELYTAKFRGLDPQIGRFIEIDSKSEGAESWSPYSAMLNNPIKNIDPLGDSTIPGGGFLRNFWEGIKDGGKSTVSFIKSLGTANGWGNLIDGLAVMSPFNVDERTTNIKASMIDGAVKYVGDVPSMTKDQVGHDLGYGTEKVGEILVVSRSPSIIGTGLGWANKTLATNYLSFVDQIDNFATIEGFTFRSGSKDFIYHNSLEAASHTRWSTSTVFSDSP